MGESEGVSEMPVIPENRYSYVSGESLEAIEEDECVSNLGTPTALRFRRLFNELRARDERLNRELGNVRRLIDALHKKEVENPVDKPVEPVRMECANSAALRIIREASSELQQVFEQGFPQAESLTAQRLARIEGLLHSVVILLS